MPSDPLAIVRGVAAATLSRYRGVTPRRLPCPSFVTRPPVIRVQYPHQDRRWVVCPAHRDPRWGYWTLQKGGHVRRWFVSAAATPRPMALFDVEEPGHGG